MAGDRKQPQFPDWIRDYKASARSRLRPAGDPDAIQRLEFYFFPSFHPECFLSITRSATATTAHFATLDMSEWSHTLRKRHPEMIARPLDQILPRPPRRISQTREVIPQAAGTFWRDMEQFDIDRIETDERFGADGIEVEVRSIASGIVHEFKVWSPAVESVHGRTIIAALAVAFNSFDSEIVLKRLTQLRCYFIRPTRSEDVQAFL